MPKQTKIEDGVSSTEDKISSKESHKTLNLNQHQNVRNVLFVQRLVKEC